MVWSMRRPLSTYFVLVGQMIYGRDDVHVRTQTLEKFALPKPHPNPKLLGIAHTGGVDGAALAALLAALAGPAPVLRHHRDPARPPRPPRHPVHRQAAQLTRYSICRQNLGIRLFPREWRFGGWELDRTAWWRWNFVGNGDGRCRGVQVWETSPSCPPLWC
jgi:hypothetical protein